MLSIILLVLGIICICLVILWIQTKIKWKRKYIKMEKEFQQSQFLQEQLNSRIDLLEQKISEEQDVQEEQKQRESFYIESIKILEQKQENIRCSCTKIHLYIQLIKEQCRTEASRQQCDIIFEECKKIMDMKNG